ncbi:MAG: DNA mismatch repair protein MutS, partial [Clostridiales bacterium]|nr:DNA mismatch repair protein MutS [Clostridiales bacterium]
MAGLTPMMEQYFQVKNEYQHCLVFFRLGDFYELFFDDALTASKELDIVLTGRDCGQAERAPMCGVPYHSAEGYIARLVEKGYKVAICEQLEDPKTTKTIVKRDVVRVITPGTVLDANMLDIGKNNYICSLYEDKDGFGLAFADVTTGDFFCVPVKKKDEMKLVDEIAKYAPAEIIANSNFSGKPALESLLKLKISLYEAWAYDKNAAEIKLLNHFRVLNLHGFGLENEKQCICAAGALLQYLYETQKNSLAHIHTIKKYTREHYMIIDASSRRNLELTETMREKSKKGSLLWVLDKTKTPMGARLLRQWIEQPLTDSGKINARLDAVGEFLGDPLFREELKELLNTVHDIERIMGRIIYASANGRDFVMLKNSLRHLPDIKNMLGNLKTERNLSLHNDLDVLADLYALIECAFVEEPPFSIREGGFISDGFDADLDRYREAKNKGTAWLLDMETKEKEATGIKNLKIRYNKVFGYYIEVTNSYKDQVPDRYVRRQTLSNCERYATEGLKEIEEAILGADEKITDLEYNLFMQIRSRVSEQIVRIQNTARVVAETDAFVSLAEAADANAYVKPSVGDHGIIDIKAGRHPVVEKMSGAAAFIANDTYLDENDDRLAIITGPNMAGKSTYMRQTALIVLMAQIGSFVPAASAEIGVTDRIFTRVGASDDLATGQSTFMVEMSEVANILNSATKHSLLILDEIGRGTSTFDGLSIAWSVLEYIADENILGAKTLFATHYHELTELEGKVPGTKNYCVTVKEQGDDIIFLRKIVRGGADHSYGIEVAR